MRSTTACPALASITEPMAPASTTSAQRTATRPAVGSDDRGAVMGLVGPLERLERGGGELPDVGPLFARHRRRIGPQVRTEFRAIARHRRQLGSERVERRTL